VKQVNVIQLASRHMQEMMHPTMVTSRSMDMCISEIWTA
jgi:hypothetical protein